MARLTALVVMLLAAGWVYACGSSLRTPPTGAHPTAHTNYVEVPYPPPAARVEVIPPRPRDDAVWVDGEWSWQGKRWVWTPGGWVVPPPGAYFAPWLTYRLESGKLLFAPGAWHSRNGQPVPRPAALVPAQNGLDEPTAPPAASSAAPGQP